jgi:predicted nucleic acid-binding protein
MSRVVADNSLLQVLTTIGRLDLPGGNLPVRITKSVRREHGRRAPHVAEDYLQDRIEAGEVIVVSPGVDTAAARLVSRFRRLSTPDAECLALAARDDAFLLAEDRALLEAAAAIDVVGVDLVAILMANRAAGRLDSAELGRIVAAIELDANHAFTAAQRAALGL